MISLQSAIRLNENVTKINQLKDDQEECETRLEKERDIYASNMFDLLAEEDNISSYILNYVKCESQFILSVVNSKCIYTSHLLSTDQQLFYKSALKEIESLMSDMNSMISELHFQSFYCNYDCITLILSHSYRYRLSLQIAHEILHKLLAPQLRHNRNCFSDE